MPIAQAFHQNSIDRDTVAASSHDSNPSPPRRCSVLYVEDHPINVLVMQALFTKRPQLELVIATTGESGVQAAQALRPDLLLLDLRLPDCHGTELLARLRAIPGLADVPAVAVTADDASDVRWAGFLEIWRKPMDVHATLQRLDRLLEGAAERPGTAVAAAASWPGAPGHPRSAPGPIPFSSIKEI